MSNVYGNPICPICGEECDTVYLDKYGDIVGCDECLDAVAASDCDGCYDENWNIGN